VILLDTNVISELVRPAPDPAVVGFLRQQVPDSVYTAAVCVAEIQYGLARMPVGRRRDDLTARMTTLVAIAFQNEVLPFDGECAAFYGEIRAGREAAGKPITVEDAMIAATVRAHAAVLATRNLADFEDTGIQLVNPRTP
jgi:predicted nucleic acid-binding protein